MGHEPDGDREHNEQVGQHDEITSITSKKIVACESGGVKSKGCRVVGYFEFSFLESRSQTKKEYTAMDSSRSHHG
jgi:hypothetical protein